MNETLYQLVYNYEPCNAQEHQDRQVMLEYIQCFEDVTTRDNHFAHFTASPWIINSDATKVLMVYHNIYDSWGWCGGHLDGDEDCLAVACREGMEETGISTLQVISSTPLALDILPVPPHVKRGAFVSSHVHLNVTYLCRGDEKEALQIKPDENRGVKWVPIEEIDQIVSEEPMKIVYEKLIRSSKKFLHDV